ncbi:MAG: polysaccharide deacetylase family protein [Candidatus Limimorpha sp.]
MRLIKPCAFLRMFYPSMLWRVPKREKMCLYLTFDDGPNPEITPQVIDILNEYNAKATFFCVGGNVRDYPDTFELLEKNGHAVGCHSFNHENGWKTDDDSYVKSFLDTFQLVGSELFRPPYGKVRYSQLRAIKAVCPNVVPVAWTVIAYDWDKSLSPDDVYHNVIDNADDGAIVAFHDSEKAYSNMISALPRVLKYYSGKGFSFCTLPVDN